uniref:Uncharacterized protein n=1 Tax=Lepeophtheirus salmonis TaxID=72036 RepID=A0A0K2U2I2_LEPSM
MFEEEFLLPEEGLFRDKEEVEELLFSARVPDSAALPNFPQRFLYLSFFFSPPTEPLLILELLCVDDEVANPDDDTPESSSSPKSRDR